MPDIGLQPGTGIPGLLSPKGVQVAWFDYQNHVLERLNTLLQTYPALAKYEDVFALMAATQNSENPEVRKIGVLASQAYTNEFFFRGVRASANPNADVSPPTETDASRPVNISTEILNAPPQEKINMFERQVPVSLEQEIVSSFESLISFRELLITRGSSMFGNGSVWVIDNHASLHAVNTYNSASPFSHQDLSRTSQDQSKSELSGSTDFLNTDSRMTSFEPLLCLSGWQHIYLTDYGVTGKRKYFENLFNCIDWNMVSKRIAPASNW